MKSLNHLIELFAHSADRGSAYPLTQDRQQCFGHLAGGNPEHKTGQNHPIDVLSSSGIGSNHFEPTVLTGPWHIKFDVSQLCKQMATVRAVAAIHSITTRQLFQIAVDVLSHLAFKDHLQSSSAMGTVVLTPLEPVEIHLLDNFVRLSYIGNCRSLLRHWGTSFIRVLANSPMRYPFPFSDTRTNTLPHAAHHLTQPT